eukprot:CAMPEP_0202696040 /NCGR_PEP_ID=MMETSP1385-20130828/9421_1 /ASSEMBLY_ACC=CAM_ASM_000861 /TAXON_ID=933848 /ORGANISM="Elphidium margaritaceum" /LENGTH=663 /DNA_ID=CAMNT_0049352137 /DNA_START=17 /DNA_END=2008 /DNA_ORIENTATION=+
MDDADGIIIPILRTIGCEIRDDITSFAQFEAAQLVHALVKCLHKIDDAKYDKISPKLPASIAKKVQIGTVISNAMKEQGFRGEIGYDKVIYPNEKDTRHLLRFLVQKLPKDGVKSVTSKRKGSAVGEEDDDDDMEGGNELHLDRRIHDSLKQWMKKPYSFLSKKAHVSQFRTAPLDYPHQPIEDAVSKPRVKYCKSSSLNFIPAQCVDNEWLVPSLLAHNDCQYLQEQSKTYMVGDEDKQLIAELFGDEHDSGSSVAETLKQCIGAEMTDAQQSIKNNVSRRNAAQSFANQSRSNLQQQLNRNTGFQLEKSYTQKDQSTARAVNDSGQLVKVDEGGNEVQDLNDEEKEEQHRKELEQMKAALMKLQDKLKKMDVEIEKQKLSYSQNGEMLKSEQTTMDTLQNKCLTLKKTIDLIPNAQQNLKKLSKIVSGTQQRFDELQSAWEDKKLSFQRQYEHKKHAMEQRKQRASDLLDEIKNMRSEMRECANSIREKEASITKMVQKLNKLPKTIDRQIYVDRILGVVQNLESQNKQIRQILDDVQSLQRDSNLVTEKSKRTFGVVDNMVFTSASNETNIDAKKQLNNIYRQIVTMREYFDVLLDTARTISNTQNEIRDIEYQIVAAKEKVETLEIKKIKNDLKEVEQENEELAKKLKVLKKQLKGGTK